MSDSYLLSAEGKLVNTAAINSVYCWNVAISFWISKFPASFY